MSQHRAFIMHNLIWILIQGDDQFALKCLIQLWRMQTCDEQDAWKTVENNNCGFTSGDALQLSQWAERVHQGTKLSEPEMKTLRKRLLKYCRQLSTYNEITKDLV